MKAITRESLALDRRLQMLEIETLKELADQKKKPVKPVSPSLINRLIEYVNGIAHP